METLDQYPSSISTVTEETGKALFFWAYPKTCIPSLLHTVAVYLSQIKVLWRKINLMLIFGNSNTILHGENIFFFNTLVLKVFPTNWHVHSIYFEKKKKKREKTVEKLRDFKWRQTL